MSGAVSVVFAPGEVSTYYAKRLPKLKQRRGAESRGPCPVHGGKDDNFSVNLETGAAYCHSRCGRGWDMVGIEMALTGSDFNVARAEIYRVVGRADSWIGSRPARPRIVATYDYTDERGDLLYQVVRYQPKGFRQRHPDGYGGWTWRSGSPQVLYHLPEVLEAPIIFVTEGEKDAETLRSHGFVATTNAGGAKAPWLASYTETLAGREVILLPDNDAPGFQRGLTVARALFGHVARLVVFKVEGAKDITEWFERGHSEIELVAQLQTEAVSQ